MCCIRQTFCTFGQAGWLVLWGAGVLCFGGRGDAAPGRRTSSLYALVALRATTGTPRQVVRHAGSAGDVWFVFFFHHQTPLALYRL